MKSKRTILSLFIVLMLVVVFALSVSAAEVVDNPPQRGPSYDQTHVDSGCCTDSATGQNHYDIGYNDGFYDGYIEGEDSKQETIDSMQSTIDSLKGELDTDVKPGDTENPDVPDTPDEPNDEGGDNGSEYWKQKYLAAVKEIEIWQGKYLEVNELYDLTRNYLARYMLYYEEANNYIELLGGDRMNDPIDDEEFEVHFDYTLTDAEKEIAIQEFLNSEEYMDKITVERTIFLTEYKGSEEYQNAMKEQYILGTNVATEEMYNSAYAEAYDAVYSLGMSDGYANYMSTAQYKNTLNNVQQKAYEQGYTEGYDVGNDGLTNDEGVTTVIALLVGVGGLIFVLFIVTYVTKKKRRKR